jgi:NADH-quinone oxidoreductase subunit J
MKAYLFYFFAFTLLFFSLMAVNSRRILRAAVYLLFVLVATSGIYFLVNYNFLAALQLTLYAGGIIVLIIFSVMLTSQLNEKLERPSESHLVLAGLASLAGIVTLLYVLIFQSHFLPVIGNKLFQVKDIAKMLVSYGKNGYALPFEVISILLLAAMIGAIVLAKNDQNMKHK